MLQYAVPLFVDGEDTLMQSRGFRNNITYTFEGDVTRSLRTSDTLLQFWKCERTDFVEEAHAHLSYLQENGCWDFDANTILNGVIGEAFFVGPAWILTFTAKNYIDRFRCVRYSYKQNLRFR